MPFRQVMVGANVIRQHALDTMHVGIHILNIVGGGTDAVPKEVDVTALVLIGWHGRYNICTVAWLHTTGSNACRCFEVLSQPANRPCMVAKIGWTIQSNESNMKLPKAQLQKRLRSEAKACHGRVGAKIRRCTLKRQSGATADQRRPYY